MLKKINRFNILIKWLSKKIISIYIFGCLCLFSCNHSTQKPDINSVNINLPLLHFEKDLFNIDFTYFSDSLPLLRKKYGEFFDLFSYKVIRIGNPENPSYPQLLLNFLTDYMINKVKKSVDSIFIDFDNTIAKKIETSFRYYKYYFPEAHIPTIITYISGFNQSMVTTDTILGISLDKYLGRHSPHYQMLGIPRYLRKKMSSDYIPADCIKAWALTQFSFNDSLDNTLLAHIIYQGKVIYFAKMLMPDESDTLIFNLSHDELKWCKKYESKMWEYLISKRYLFSSDFQLIKRFIDEAPFTKDFGQKSPGRAVIWLGYNMINQYVNNTKSSLQDLMKNNDYQQILKKSKYKP